MNLNLQHIGTIRNFTWNL